MDPSLNNAARQLINMQNRLVYRILFAGFALFGTLSLLAQCTINSFDLNTTCASHDPFGAIDISGGTPPYQLVFTNSGGYSNSIQVNSNGVTNLILFGAAIAAPPMQVTITDSQNCTATASAWYYLRQAMFPELLVSYPCTTGAELRWTGRYDQLSHSCGATHYDISDIGGFVRSGLLSSDWVQEPNGYWLFGETLPPGTYSVYIGMLNGECDQGSGLILCPSSSQVIIQTGTPANCYTQLNLRAALAGAMTTGTTMSDALRVAGLLPTTEPYVALGYSYTGPLTSSSFSTSVFTNSNALSAIVDWVVVELRASNNSSTVVYSTAALIRRDGSIVNYPLNAPTTLRMPMPPGNYYVAIRHRNHLGVMTSGLIPLSTTGSALDLRSLTATYGVGAQRSVNGILALWPGDANFDGTAIYTGANNDRDLILTAIGGTIPTNTVSNTYSRLDINMDGTIRYTGTNNDRDVILQTIGGVVPTATRVQQLP